MISSSTSVPSTLVCCAHWSSCDSHGFTWPDGADTTSYILPLYHYVKNVNRTEEGGYYGK